MRASGASKKLVKTLMDGEFTPVQFSEKRFETKVETIENELDKMYGKFNYRLNEDFVFPENELEDIMDEYEDKDFFEKGNEYDPEKFDYVLDKKGNMILNDNGDPIRDEGFIKSTLRKVSPLIKKGVNKLLNPLSNDFKVQAPPLPETPQPKINNKMLASNTNTGLTRSENALLSETEKEIAKRV